ncbi:MAG: FkbM family methyltransferase [Cytophagales bacterium]|nr:FkbM family methyltransferase [Cytophagales bacterium]
MRPGTTDIDVYYQIFIYREYDFLANHIQKNNIYNIYTIIDAGANIGCTSLYFYNQYQNAKIISIEADESNFDILNKNIRLNNAEKRIFPLHKAIWYNNDKELYISNKFRDGKNWSLSVQSEKIDAQSPVKSTTIQNLAAQYNIEKIDILKIDIEGAEKYIFVNEEYEPDFLNYVKIIALEIHDEYEIRPQIKATLHKYNFDLIETVELTIGIKKF